MSRPQSTPRPGAHRPTPAGPAQKASKGPSVEELRSLPAFVEDGDTVEFTQDSISSGRIADETVTIGSAKIRIQDWRKKDGTYPVRADGRPYYPEVQLELGFRRDGDEESDRLYTLGFKYANVGTFGPSKDGNSLRRRKGSDGKPVPGSLRKWDPAVMFLQSVENAGGKDVIARYNKEGASALVGLRVHIREQRVSGMPEKQPDVILVDYIEGGSAAPAASAPKAGVKKAEAPAATAEVPAADDTRAVAEEALVELLTAAENNTLGKSAIAQAVIQNAKWKAHPQRAAILKTLRDENFINDGKKWVVDGSNIILA